jgi:hypothetical protein
VSLRNNAERLLRDVRLAHGGLTARLDQSAPGGSGRRGDEAARGGATGGTSRQGDRDDGPDDELEVPEFVPPG